jgi:osmotically-inducible protein OsmY
MNTAVWNIVPVVALLSIVPAGLSARAAAPQNVVEKTESGAKKAGGAVVKGAKVVGEKTKDGLSKTGEVMTDGWITTRVNARFVNEDLLKGSDINVDSDNHVVTLKGTVTSNAGRRKASSVAKGTEGVRRVVNRLTVAAKS